MEAQLLDLHPKFDSEHNPCSPWRFWEGEGGELPVGDSCPEHLNLASVTTLGALYVRSPSKLVPPKTLGSAGNKQTQKAARVSSTKAVLNQ